MEVDGVSYNFPENMTFEDNILTFSPSEPWPHNRVIAYNLADAEDSMGCDLDEEVAGAFITDLLAPEIILYDPPCGFQFGDSIDFTWHITDFPSGVDISTIKLDIDGTEYTPGDGYLTYTVSGMLAEGDLNFRVNGFDIGIMPGDTFIACLSISDAVLPVIDSCGLCGPNDTIICCEYSISPCIGPVATTICPPSSIPTDTAISACPYQNITVELIGPDNPIDPSTILMQVNGDDYSTSNIELSYFSDTVVFAPQSPWMHEQVVRYNLYRANDTRGCTIAEQAASYFYIDLEPPIVYNVQPEPGYEFTGLMNLSFWVEDAPAGVDRDNIVVTVEGREFTVNDGFLSYSGNDEAGVASIMGEPEEFGIARGDTFEVCILLSDLVLVNNGVCELCGPNDTVYCYNYMFYPQTSCERIPNPFTPNGDGINDYAQFMFPEMYRLDGIISIFDIRNRKISEIQVGGGTGAVQTARWDGNDGTGAPVPEGLYIYIIKTENQVVCQGTVTLAR